MVMEISVFWDTKPSPGIFGLLLKLGRKFLRNVDDHLTTCYFLPVRSGPYSNVPCCQTPSGHLVPLRMSSATTDKRLWTGWSYTVSRK